MYVCSTGHVLLVHQMAFALHDVCMPPLLGSSERKMNLETEIPVMTHCKEPALTSKTTLTFLESVNGLILY